MGKTVVSFRIALEGERLTGGGALRREDREAFDELMDACSNNAAVMKKGWMYG